MLALLDTFISRIRSLASIGTLACTPSGFAANIQSSMVSVPSTSPEMSPTSSAPGLPDSSASPYDSNAMASISLAHLTMESKLAFDGKPWGIKYFDQLNSGIPDLPLLRIMLKFLSPTTPWFRLKETIIEAVNWMHPVLGLQVDRSKDREIRLMWQRGLTIATIFFPDDPKNEANAFSLMTAAGRRRFKISSATDFCDLLVSIYDCSLAYRIRDVRGQLEPGPKRAALIQSFREGEAGNNCWLAEALHNQRSGKLYNAIFCLARALSLQPSVYDSMGMNTPIALGRIDPQADWKRLDHMADWRLAVKANEANHEITIQICQIEWVETLRITSAPDGEGSHYLARLFEVIVAAYEAEVRDEARRLSERIKRLPKTVVTCLSEGGVDSRRFESISRRLKRKHAASYADVDHNPRAAVLRRNAQKTLRDSQMPPGKKMKPYKSDRSTGYGRMELGMSSLAHELTGHETGGTTTTALTVPLSAFVSTHAPASVSTHAPSSTASPPTPNLSSPVNSSAISMPEEHEESPIEKENYTSDSPEPVGQDPAPWEEDIDAFTLQELEETLRQIRLSRTCSIDKYVRPQPKKSQGAKK